MTVVTRPQSSTMDDAFRESPATGDTSAQQSISETSRGDSSEVSQLSKRVEEFTWTVESLLKAKLDQLTSQASEVDQTGPHFSDVRTLHGSDQPNRSAFDRSPSPGCEPVIRVTDSPDPILAANTRSLGSHDYLPFSRLVEQHGDVAQYPQAINFSPISLPIFDGRSSLLAV